MNMSIASENSSPKEGTIIILNGPSSVGKSSIQNALQIKSNQFFVRIGIDSFFDSLLPEPDISQLEIEKKLDQYTNSGEYIRGIRYQEDEEGNAVVPLLIGPAGDRVMKGMHRAIAEYAKMGNYLVVDYILYKQEYLADLVESLKGQRVIWVGVFAPLSVIEEREKQRNTSPVGHARSHYKSCHQNVKYDLKLDSTNSSPEESAEKILHFLTKK